MYSGHKRIHCLKFQVQRFIHWHKILFLNLVKNTQLWKEVGVGVGVKKKKSRMSVRKNKLIN